MGGKAGQPKRTCRKKKVYATDIEATIAAYRYEYQFGTEQDFYVCDICGKFHLTSRGLK